MLVGSAFFPHIVALKTVGFVSGRLAEPCASLSLSKPLSSPACNGILLQDEELEATRVAVVGVEAVVLVVLADQVVRVDGAAEELEAVVERLADLDVIDLRAAADAAEREAVDLVVGG